MKRFLVVLILLYITSPAWGAKMNVKAAASSSRIEYIFIQNSSVTTGAGLTGLVYNTGSLIAYYVRGGAAAASINLITQTVTGAYSSGGFVEVDSTHMPGVYRIDIPDTCFATGSNQCVVMISGASNMAPVLLEYELDANTEADTYAVVTSGTYGNSAIKSAIPAAAPTAAAVATAVWEDTLSGGDFGTAGSIGLLLDTDIDTNIGSRGTSTYSGGAVASVTAGVTLAASQHVIVDSGTITTYTGNTPQTGDSFAVVKSSGTGDNVSMLTTLNKLGFTGSGPYYLKVDVTDWKGSTAPAMTGDAYAAINLQVPTALTGDPYAQINLKIPTALSFTGAYVQAQVKGQDNIDFGALQKASITAVVPSVASIQSGLATPTNITAGTITTVTNLTNAPTNGDLTSTMKSSVTTATTAATPTVICGTVSDKTGYALTSAYDPAKACNATAPDNADISTIKGIVNNIHFDAQNNVWCVTHGGLK